MQRYKQHLLDLYGSQKQEMRIWANGVEIGSRRVNVPAQCPVGSCTDGKFDATWHTPHWRARHASRLHEAGDYRFGRQQGGSYSFILHHQHLLDVARAERQLFKPLP